MEKENTSESGTDIIKSTIIPDDVLIKKIHVIREQFPEDFMFQLTEKEFESLRSQIATLKIGRGGRTYLPNVFTEQGVAMLSQASRSN